MPKHGGNSSKALSKIEEIPHFNNNEPLLHLKNQWRGTNKNPIITIPLNLKSKINIVNDKELLYLKVRTTINTNH